MKRILLVACIACFIFSCNNTKLEKKGFQVSEVEESEDDEKPTGLNSEKLKIETRPRNVLLTTHAEHRLSPIYKVNYNKETNIPFVGSNQFYSNWENDEDKGNNWNNNFMPGLNAMYGYNLVNISHYNVAKDTTNNLFEAPVLIKTFYYPAFSKDTLNFKPIARHFYLASVYDEDSNEDGFINFKDLRRIYYFDVHGKNKTNLVPKNYSVQKSAYDLINDYMYVFAIQDENKNGKIESTEKTHVFWIDLSNPLNHGRLYGSN